MDWFRAVGLVWVASPPTSFTRPPAGSATCSRDMGWLLRLRPGRLMGPLPSAYGLLAVGVEQPRGERFVSERQGAVLDPRPLRDPALGPDRRAPAVPAADEDPGTLAARRPQE